MSPWSQYISLVISIVEINNKPYVLHQSTLSLAVGTRRSITSDIITVVDQETPDNIQYTVESVDCVSCTSATWGQVVNGAGLGIKYFSQEEINTGRVFFQHSAVSAAHVILLTTVFCNYLVPRERYQTF